MVDSQQADNNLRPLTGFLFRCTFTAQEGDKVLTEAALKKLQYSVLSVNIPKMKEQELDELSYGSFFISFPFWSTGDQAMTIEFWETDKMEISKIFYYMLDKKRWRASTMFKYSQADLFVTVEILDQRNYLPADKHVIFSNTFALKTVSIDPPEFVRTGDVTLLKTKVEFNTMQHEYSHGNIRTGINPLGDFMDKNVYMPDENAFIDAEDMSKKIEEAFKEYVKAEQGRFPEKANATDKFVTDKVSSDVELRAFADRLGPNSLSRTAALSTDSNARQELRKILMKKGVNVNDYSDVANALKAMGIYGADGQSNHYCQRGVSLLESIVSGNDRVLSPKATGSEQAWEAGGFKEDKSLGRKINKVSDADAYINELIKSGKVHEGDKIIIDYDAEDKENGHALTVLFDDATGKWSVSSDAGHFNLSGLAMNHKIDEIHILNMTKEEKDRRSGVVPGSSVSKADFETIRQMSKEDVTQMELEAKLKKSLEFKKPE